jgi:hypothetical protein
MGQERAMLSGDERSIRDASPSALAPMVATAGFAVGRTGLHPGDVSQPIQFIIRSTSRTSAGVLGLPRVLRDGRPLGPAFACRVPAVPCRGSHEVFRGTETAEANRERSSAAIPEAVSNARPRSVLPSSARCGRRPDVRHVPRCDRRDDHAANLSARGHHHEHVHRVPQRPRRKGRLHALPSLKVERP